MPAGRPKGTFKGLHPCRVNGKMTKTYQAWQSMIARCHGNHPASRYYKGRGIAVCAQWRDKATGYDCFVADVGVAPPKHWIDRIDNDGDYEPGNVRWVTPKESAGNRRQGGGANAQPMSLSSICGALGVSYPRVYQRMKLWNWTIYEAFKEKMPTQDALDAS